MIEISYPSLDTPGVTRDFVAGSVGASSLRTSVLPRTCYARFQA